jgi:YbgC/YbaW family acyl-CoA thioester hydrolase
MVFEYRRKIFGYECDIYGHLNNAAYQHLYEEARSAALDEMQLPLKVLAELGIQIFVKRIEIDYISGVPFGLEIMIKSRVVEFSRVKSVWIQEIYHPDNRLLSRAVLTGVFTKESKPYRIDRNIAEKLARYQENA